MWRRNVAEIGVEIVAVIVVDSQLVGPAGRGRQDRTTVRTNSCTRTIVRCQPRTEHLSANRCTGEQVFDSARRTPVRWSAWPTSRSRKRQRQILDFIESADAASAATRRRSARSARRSGSPHRPPCTATSTRSAARVTCGATRPSPRAIEVRWDPNSGVVMERRPVRHVPLVGDVAAGTDVLAQENVEELFPVPDRLHRRRRPVHAAGARRLDDRRRHPRRRLRGRRPADHGQRTATSSSPASPATRPRSRRGVRRAIGLARAGQPDDGADGVRRRRGQHLRAGRHGDASPLTPSLRRSSGPPGTTSPDVRIRRSGSIGFNSGGGVGRSGGSDTADDAVVGRRRPPRRWCRGRRSACRQWRWWRRRRRRLVGSVRIHRHLSDVRWSRRPSDGVRRRMQIPARPHRRCDGCCSARPPTGHRQQQRPEQRHRRSRR